MTAFDRSSTPSGGGLTIKGNQLAGTTIYSSVWEHSPASGNLFSQSTFYETTLHELGHAFDIFFGRQSAGTTYDGYVQNDFLNLDYEYLDPTSYSSSSDKGSSVPRLPCAPTPMPGGGNYPGNAPFANDSRVCSGTTVLSPSYTSLTTNSEIAQDLPPTSVDSTSYYFSRHVPRIGKDPAWNELYAQTLAWAAWGSGRSEPL